MDAADNALKSASNDSFSNGFSLPSFKENSDI